MFEDSELEQFIRDKLYYMYKQHIKYYREDVTQDDMCRDFKRNTKTEDFIFALVKDVRFTAIIDKWLKNITWKEILKNELEKKFDYKNYFMSKSKTNNPQVYQDYLEGNVKEPVKALCYAHDIACDTDKTRLELAFPLLFDEHKKMLDKLEGKEVQYNSKKHKTMLT